MARILFVCSGNTCRSALAEGIARARLSPGSEVTFESAGLSVLAGGPAAPQALAVAAEAGVDLGTHRARPLTREMVEGADRIYAMTRSQVEALTRLGMSAGARVALLDPAGADIPDPYGGDLDAYRRARDRIVAALEARWEEWRSGR